MKRDSESAPENIIEVFTRIEQIIAEKTDSIFIRNRIRLRPGEQAELKQQTAYLIIENYAQLLALHEQGKAQGNDKAALEQAFNEGAEARQHIQSLFQKKGLSPDRAESAMNAIDRVVRQTMNPDSGLPEPSAITR